MPFTVESGEFELQGAELPRWAPWAFLLIPRGADHPKRPGAPHHAVLCGVDDRRPAADRRRGQEPGVVQPGEHRL